MEDDGGGLLISKVDPQIKAAVSKVTHFNSLSLLSSVTSLVMNWWGSCEVFRLIAALAINTYTQKITEEQLLIKMQLSSVEDMIDGVM